MGVEHSKQKCESVPTVLVTLAALHHMSVQCSKGEITHQALCCGAPQCRRLNTYNTYTSCKAGQNCPVCLQPLGRQHQWEMHIPSTLRPQIHRYTRVNHAEGQKALLYKRRRCASAVRCLLLLDPVVSFPPTVRRLPQREQQHSNLKE